MRRGKTKIKLGFAKVKTDKMRQTKTLNLTYDEEDFERMKKLKSKTCSWEKFIFIKVMEQ